MGNRITTAKYCKVEVARARKSINSFSGEEICNCSALIVGHLAASKR